MRLKPLKPAPKPAPKPSPRPAPKLPQNLAQLLDWETFRAKVVELAKAGDPEAKRLAKRLARDSGTIKRVLSILRTLLL